MGSAHKSLFVTCLILAAIVNGTQALATVTGMVFCDQCRDGEVSIFDYPLYGAKVTVTCSDSSGQMLMSREETTNWFGSYTVRFDGSPDLNNCQAQVSGYGQGSNACAAAAGPAQKLRLMFRMLDMEMYSVDSLLSEPPQPMSLCPRSASPVPPSVPITRPPAPVAPVVYPPPPPFTLPSMPPLPPLPQLPPLPPLPSLPPMPPMPLFQASACPHKNWTKPEYRCYWTVLTPDSKVALVFGPLAARRYGTDMTLWQAIQGGGDPYKTLLREATVALLNSYNSLQFPYNNIEVSVNMNRALTGSTRSVLMAAYRFLKANSGSGRLTCNFTPCK